MSAGQPETLTLLVCGKNFSATKSISLKDGDVHVEGFEAGKYFGAMIVPVGGIEELSQYLGQLEASPNAFVIRGSPTSPVGAEQTYRRTKENFRTPADGKRWLMIDFDKLAIPSDLDLAANPTAVIEHLVRQLPKEFHDASYHYQLSSSAGFSAPSTVSAHVWFWLTDPWPDEKLKTWSKAVNEQVGYKLIDPALFNDVQAHYTAAPIFKGVEDPFRKRSALVKKTKDLVFIRYIKIPARPALQPSGSVESGPGFEGWLARIGDHQGGDGFHEPVIKAIASYVNAHGRDDTNVEALYEVIRARILATDRSQHDDVYVDQMADRKHIMDAIDGALKKYGDRPASRHRSRVVAGVVAPAATPPLSSIEASQRLSDALDCILKSGIR